MPGVLYHVISRFVDREWFIDSDEERTFYIDLLGRAIRKSDWTCIAYAVMSNHIHVAALAGTDKLDTWVRRVHAPFADYMNRQHKRIGNIFTRGPKTIPIPYTRAGHLIAYVHNNPVRAKLVATPSESTWTSHAFYTGDAPAPRWFNVNRGLELAARGTPAEFDAWVASAPSHPLYRDSHPDESYEEAIANYEEEQVRLRTTRRMSLTSVPATLLEFAAKSAGLELAQLRSRRRGRSEVLARAIVVRCCDSLGFTSTQIAAALDITAPAVLGLRRSHTQRADVVQLSQQIVCELRGAESAQEHFDGQGA